LPAEGGTIELWNNAGRLLDSMSYAFVEPWPVGPGGSGASLAKRVPRSASERGESWAASAQVGGTPGADNGLAPRDDGPSGLAFHELPGSGAGGFWLELVNRGAEPVELGGHLLRTSAGAEHELPAAALAPSELFLLTEAELGFRAVPGERLFLLAPDRATVLDAVRVTELSRGRGSSAPATWRHPAEVTPGAPNVFVEEDALVINEILYHAPPVATPDGSRAASELEWIELFNRGTAPIDVGGYTFVDAIEFELPAGTVIPGGEYLVVARTRRPWAAAYPPRRDRTCGDFRGSPGGLRRGAGPPRRLRRRGGPRGVLRRRTLAAFADGGGSSSSSAIPTRRQRGAGVLGQERRSRRSAWQTITYEGVRGAQCGGADGAWQELVIGLLDAGVALLDDVSVVVDPAGARRSSSRGEVRVRRRRRLSAAGQPPPEHVCIAEPTDPPTRPCGSSPPVHRAHAQPPETTLAGGHVITNRTDLPISLRARWEGGSNLLHTRLYFNRLARTTALARPVPPGRRRREHRARRTRDPRTATSVTSRPCPHPDASVEVAIVAADPDGVADVTPPLRRGGGSPVAVPMTRRDGDRYAAAIPGQPASSGSSSGGGRGRGGGPRRVSRARSGRPRALPGRRRQAATNGLHNLRLVMTRRTPTGSSTRSTS
jgi:hypothetical protein